MGEKTMTASALRQHLIDKATADSEFRNQLVAEPKAAIEAETGLTVPSEFNVEVHQDTATTGHLVLPPPPSSEKPIWRRPPAATTGPLLDKTGSRRPLRVSCPTGGHTQRYRPPPPGLDCRSPDHTATMR